MQLHKLSSENAPELFKQSNLITKPLSKLSDVTSYFNSVNYKYRSGRITIIHKCYNNEAAYLSSCSPFRFPRIGRWRSPLTGRHLLPNQEPPLQSYPVQQSRTTGITRQSERQVHWSLLLRILVLSVQEDDSRSISSQGETKEQIRDHLDHT